MESKKSDLKKSRRLKSSSKGLVIMPPETFPENLKSDPLFEEEDAKKKSKEKKDHKMKKSKREKVQEEVDDDDDSDDDLNEDDYNDDGSSVPEKGSSSYVDYSGSSSSMSSSADLSDTGDDDDSDQDGLDNGYHSDDDMQQAGATKNFSKVSRSVLRASCSKGKPLTGHVAHSKTFSEFPDAITAGILDKQRKSIKRKNGQERRRMLRETVSLQDGDLENFAKRMVKAIADSDRFFEEERGITIERWLEEARRKRLEMVPVKKGEDIAEGIVVRRRSHSTNFNDVVFGQGLDLDEFREGVMELVSKIGSLEESKTPKPKDSFSSTNETARPGNRVPGSPQGSFANTCTTQGSKVRDKNLTLSDVQKDICIALDTQDLGMDAFTLDEDVGEDLDEEKNQGEVSFFTKRREALVPEDWKEPPSMKIPRSGCSKEFLVFMNEKMLNIIDRLPTNTKLETFRNEVNAIVFGYFSFNVAHVLLRNLRNVFYNPVGNDPDSSVPPLTRRIRIVRIVLFIAYAAGHWKISWHLLASFLLFFDSLWDAFKPSFSEEVIRRLIMNWNLPDSWLGVKLVKPSLVWQKILAYINQRKDSLEWFISDDEIVSKYLRPENFSSFDSSDAKPSDVYDTTSIEGSDKKKMDMWLRRSADNGGNEGSEASGCLSPTSLSASSHSRSGFSTLKPRFDAAKLLKSTHASVLELTPELLEIACRSTSYSATEPKSLRHREFRDKFHGTALLEHACKALNVFPDTVMSCANAMISKNHIQGVKNEKSFVATSSFFFPPRSDPDDFLDLEKFPLSTFKSKPGVEPTFLDIDVVELAQQITLYEQTMFKDLRLCEFFSGKMSDTDGNVRNKVCPNATLIAEFQNRMQPWVLTTIVTSKSISTGAKTLQRMILLAHELMKMHNFSASNSIVMCLIQFNLEVNLPRTYKKISGEARELLKSMREELRNPTALFEKAPVPKIPSFFRFSADSTKAIDHCKEEAGDDKIKRKWAPFEVGTRFARLVIDSQSRMYPFKYNSDIQHYLRNLKAKGFGEIGRLADQLEGKK